MSDFVQAVFDEISLERDPFLWQSTDDSRTGDRILFLSRFPQTDFVESLRRKSSPLSKNDVLAKAALASAERRGSGKEAVAACNQGLAFASHDSDTADRLRELRARLCADKQVSSATSSQEWNAGEAFAVKCDRQHGRFVVADRDLEPGDVIAVDRPLATFLDKDVVRLFCWHCLRRMGVAQLEACRGCSGVVFCSPACQKQANESYHRYECQRTDILYQSNVGTWLLALRAVASTSPDVVLDRQSHDDAKWETLCGLVAHEDYALFLAPHLMKEALVCVFLVRFLCTRGYLDNSKESSGEFTSRQLHLALSLHKVMRIIKFNCHEVHSSADSGTRRIGVAINGRLALINHSCNPNYGRVWADGGRVVVAYATRSIREGEEITDCYSGNFAHVDKDARAIVHQHYLFECSCEACASDWPTLTMLPSSPRGLANNRYLAMKKSERDKRIAQVETLLREAKEQHCQDVSAWKKLLLAAQELLRPPHALLVVAEENIYLALWAQIA